MSPAGQSHPEYAIERLQVGPFRRRIAIDPIFPPPSIEELTTLTKKLMLPDSPVETNKFELIFDEVEEGK